MIPDRALWNRIETAAIVLGFLALSGVLRAGETGALNPRSPAGAVKVLHFPPDQCLGSLYFQPEPAAMWDPKQVAMSGAGDYIGIAQGDVTVPAGRQVQLNVNLALTAQEATRRRAQDPRSYRQLVTDRVRPDPYDLSALSHLDPNDLYMLIVNGLGTSTDTDRRVLEPIARLTGLRVLRLHGTGVTDRGMEQLRALRELRAIEFSTEWSVKNEGLAVLKDLPELEYLDLYTGTTDIGLKYIGQSSNLRWLRIRTGLIWGPGLAELAHASRLERLCLWGETGLSDQHVAYLQGLTQLKSLTLWGSACDTLTDASLASIGKLRDLEELHFILASPSFTPAGVAQLKNLNSLKKVDFAYAWSGPAGVQYGDEVARQLATMPQLEAAEGLAYLSAEGVKSLATLRNLKCLDINLKVRRQGYLGPTGLSHLAELGSLETLGITTNDPLSDADLASLESLTHLRDLHILSYGVTDEGLASIGQLKRLERLTLGGPVPRSGLNHLNGLSNLQYLQVSSWPRDAETAKADELTLDLSGLGKLKNLNLSGLPLEDSDLAFLERLLLLEWLTIQATPSLPGTSLRHLAELKELDHLMVNGLSDCTGEDLASLNGLSKLRDLTLRGEIPDSAIASLDGLTALWSLNVSTSEPIRPQTVTDLKQRLEAVEYVHFSDEPPVQQQSGSQRQDRSGSTPRRTRTDRRRERR